jgi:hypothetical protein
LGDGDEYNIFNTSIMDRDLKKPNESGRNNYKTIGELQMMQSTMTTASQIIGNKFKEVLKMKLSYEWKKIYRILSMQDA